MTAITIGAWAPSRRDPSIKMRAWNVWSNNYIESEGGYITHAQDSSCKDGRSVCGVRVYDGGLLSIPEETEPCCKRCRKILEKRGILTPREKKIVYKGI